MSFVDKPSFYLYKCTPEKREQIRQRLTQIEEAGMTEVMIAEFGVPDVVTGLYIENVWHFTDTEFQDYMDWAIGLINKRKINE